MGREPDIRFIRYYRIAVATGMNESTDSVATTGPINAGDASGVNGSTRASSRADGEQQVRLRAHPCPAPASDSRLREERMSRTLACRLTARCVVCAPFLCVLTTLSVIGSWSSPSVGQSTLVFHPAGVGDVSDGRLPEATMTLSVPCGAAHHIGTLVVCEQAAASAPSAEPKPAAPCGRVVVPMDLRRWNTPGLWPMQPPPDSARRPVTTRAKLTANRRPALVYSSATPQVRLATTGPSQVTVGEPAGYRFLVENPTKDVARGVLVTVALAPAVDVAEVEAAAGAVARELTVGGRRAVKWALEQLEPGASSEMTVTIRPISTDPVAMDVAWSVSAEPQPLKIDTLRPELELVFSGPDTVVAGDTPVFAIEVTNPGNAAARDVVVELATEAGKTKSVPVGRLAAGETRPFRVAVAKLPPGLTQLTATAWANGGLRREAVRAITVSRAQLAITAFGPPTRQTGGEAAYTVRVANHGGAVAEDVLATTLLPAGVVAHQLPEGATKLGGLVTHPLGQLLPGEAREFTVACTIESPGDHILQFTATDRRQNEAAARLATHSEAAANVQMTVDAGPAELSIGEELNYLITLRNHGSRPAHNVRVGMELDKGVQIEAAEGADWQQSGSRVEFSPIPLISTDKPVVLQITARGRHAGYCSYRVEAATATGDVRLACEGGNQFVPASRAPAEIDMRVQVTETQTVVGGELVYEIELAAIGKQAAEDVQVTLRCDPQVEPLRVDGGRGRIAGSTVFFEPLTHLGDQQRQTLRVAARARREGICPYRVELTTADQRTRLAREGIVRVQEARSGEKVRSIAIRPGEVSRR